MKVEVEFFMTGFLLSEVSVKFYFFWILSWVQLLCASYSGLNTDEQC